MMAAATALSAGVDTALNLVIGEVDDGSSMAESGQPEQTSDQSIYADDSDKEKMELNEPLPVWSVAVNEPVPSWPVDVNEPMPSWPVAVNEPVPTWPVAVDEPVELIAASDRYETREDVENPANGPVTEAPAFDFTKIETLFGTKRAAEPSSEQPEGKIISSEVDMSKEQISLLKHLQIEDLVFRNIVIAEVNSKGNNAKQLRNNKNVYSLNASVRVKKSPSSDENKQRSPNQQSRVGGVAKNRNFKTGKQKKPVPKKRKKDVAPVIPATAAAAAAAAAPASPLHRPATPLTPSLDPELLRQFEEEDRPKRVLRSSTVAASSMSKTGNSRTSNSSFASEKKKLPRRQRIKKPARRSKQLSDFANYAVPVTSAFIAEHSAGNGRKRRRSESDMDKKPSPKHLKMEVDALLDQGIVVALDDYNFVSRKRQCSSASTSHAGTSSSSNVSMSILNKENGPGHIRSGLSSVKSRRRTQSSNFYSSWELMGPGFKNYIYINNDMAPLKRICYQQARHSKTGDFLRIRDAVRVKSVGAETNFGCIARLFKHEKTGMPMATVLWYYSPKQVQVENASPPIAARELLASRHIDVISLDSVDEIIRVLTYNEYARFMAETTNDAYPSEQRVTEDELLWRKGEDNYPRRQFLPCDDTPLELVFFCRRVYDFKQHRITTRPSASRKQNCSAKRTSRRYSLKH